MPELQRSLPDFLPQGKRSRIAAFPNGGPGPIDSFQYHLSQVSFQGGNNMVALRVDQNGNALLAAPINWAVHEYLLKDGALGWFSPQMAEVDLSFLNFVAFIAVIAVMVQLVEMVIEKTSTGLYHALGIYLPLITVNCSILGGSLFMVERSYSFSESVVFGLSSGVGWALAIIALASIREKIRYSNVPPALRGLGITMLLTGLMSIGFMSYSGISL